MSPDAFITGPCPVEGHKFELARHYEDPTIYKCTVCGLITRIITGEGSG